MKLLKLTNNFEPFKKDGKEVIIEVDNETGQRLLKQKPAYYKLVPVEPEKPRVARENNEPKTP